MSVSQISPAEVADLLRRGAAFTLLDCREPEEVRSAAIAGATHVAMGDIPARLPALDPDRPTVVFCHHGVRSLTVAAFLEKQGFSDVRSMRGGIDAWSREVDPAVPRYVRR